MYEREFAGDDRSAARPAGIVNSLGFRSGIVIGIVVGLIVMLVLLAVPDVTDDPAVIRDKLEKIGLAFQLHHDSFGYFAQPRGGVHGTKLSWRVDLLPFLGHQQLYDQFHLHEPWDSPHNLQLLDLMPDVFRIGDKASHLTRIRVLAGPGSIFEPGTLSRHALLTDGAANTILAVAVSSELAVPWTQPDELGIQQSPTDAGIAECLMADGQLLTLPFGTSPEIWRGLATPGGGELIDADKLRRQFRPDRQPAAGGLQTMQDSVTRRTKRMANMKQLVLGMHNYHDAYRQFPIALPYQSPPAATSLKLSWRVHLLPFLDQQPLYEQFHLNETWDSPHNRALLSQMPDIYLHPNGAHDATTTRVMLLTGPGTPFADAKSIRLRDFADGTSNTILLVECGYDKAVPWTKPEDLAFDAAHPVACLGHYNTPGFVLATVDGAVRHLKPSVPAELFLPLVTPAGKEIVSGELQHFGLWR